MAIFSGHLSGSLVVNILSLLDSTALYGCNVELEDASTGVVVQTVTRSEANTFQMPLFSEKKYRLIVSRQGFYPAFIELEATTTNCFQTVKKEVVLKPMR